MMEKLIWRRRNTAHDQKHATLSDKYGGGSVTPWTLIATNEIELLVCTDHVTADGGNRMNCEVYRTTVFAQIQANSAKLIRPCFTAQNGNVSRSWVSVCFIIIINFWFHLGVLL